MDLGIQKSSEDEHPTSKLECLPCEISLDILSRIPITSLMQFRSVNRNCRQLSYDPNLVLPHFSHSLMEKNPSLILHSNCDYPDTNYLYYVEFSGSDNHDEENVRKIRTPFQDVYVIASCNGLLCVSDSKHRLFIYNPFSKGREDLPVSMVFKDDDMVGFGWHPLIDEYKVVVIGSQRQGQKSEVHVTSIGNGSWRKLGIPPYPLDRQASQALVNGRFHWFTKQMTIWQGRHRLLGSRKIVSFDLLDEQFREIPIPNCSKKNLVHCHLTVLGGHLSAVFCCPLATRSFEIWIMEEYDLGESWVQISRIAVSSLLPREQFQSPLMLDRVLCLLKNGNILVSYRDGVLVSHDPNSQTFTRLMLQGLPNAFAAFAHVGSLNWIDTTTKT